MKLFIDRFTSPLGEILLVSDGTNLCGLDFADYEARLMQSLQKRYPAGQLIAAIDPQGFSSKIRAYFDHDYQHLADIPVQAGGTAFQRQVWQELRTISVGTTISYGELAHKLGKPTAARAVGMANSRNPIAIVVPCHRVIGASSQLTGYAGGLERKRWLLHHES
jgi:methylated-DNA-[protein]-cysteine S-methyltransferase